jgi:hypothetical protein
MGSSNSSSNNDQSDEIQDDLYNEEENYRSPNDQRSDVKNPNNDDYWKDKDNRDNQANNKNK